MPSVIGVFLPGGTGSLGGKIFISDEGFSGLRRLYWPPGINALARHGSGYVYTNRNYVVGAWSANLLIDENFRVLRQGIIPPQSPPSVSVGAGSTDQICYLTFYDILTDQRSSLSEGTTVTGDTTRTWSNLPTTVPGEAAVIEGTYTFTAGAVACSAGTGNVGQLRPGDRVAKASDLTRWAVIKTIIDDDNFTVDDLGMTGTDTLVHKPVSRCQYLELWVSVAGTLPRLSSRVPLGVTGFVEAVATLSLGEAFLDTYEPMPFGTMNVTYGDREILAGNPQNRDTVYLSNLFEHEQWGGLSFKTKYGEPITGLVRMRDYVLVLCPESSYILQGYTEDDLELRVCEPDIGGFGHTTNIVLRGRAFIPNAQGYFMFNGAFHSILEDNQYKWQELYKTYRREYETGIVVHDKAAHTLIFIPNYDEESTYSTKTFFEKAGIILWTLDHTTTHGLDAGGVSQPSWAWDDHFVEEFEIKSAAYLQPTETALGKLYKITIDGKVWVEDPAVTGPLVEVVTGHYYFGDIGGDIQEGKTLRKLWAYFYGDYATTDIDVFAGDDYAGGDDINTRILATPSVFPPSIGSPVLYTPNTVNIPASLLTSPPEVYPPSLSGDPDFAWAIWGARTVYTWSMNDLCPTGRGFTFRFRFTDHKLLEWYGLGGYIGPGEAGREVNWYESGG